MKCTSGLILSSVCQYRQNVPCWEMWSCKVNSFSSWAQTLIYLSSCPGFPVSPAAGTWTYEPLRLQPCSCCYGQLSDMQNHTHAQSWVSVDIQSPQSLWSGPSGPSSSQLGLSRHQSLFHQRHRGLQLLVSIQGLSLRPSAQKAGPFAWKNGWKWGLVRVQGGLHWSHTGHSQADALTSPYFYTAFLYPTVFPLTSLQTTLVPLFPILHRTSHESSAILKYPFPTPPSGDPQIPGSDLFVCGVMATLPLACGDGVLQPRAWGSPGQPRGVNWASCQWRWHWESMCLCALGSFMVGNEPLGSWLPSFDAQRAATWDVIGVPHTDSEGFSVCGNQLHATNPSTKTITWLAKGYAITVGRMLHFKSLQDLSSFKNLALFSVTKMLIKKKKI